MFGARKRGLIRQKLETIRFFLSFISIWIQTFPNNKKIQLFCPFAKVYKTKLKYMNICCLNEDDFAFIEQLMIPATTTKNTFPTKVVCMLTSWKSLTFEEFQVKFLDLHLNFL